MFTAGITSALTVRQLQGNVQGVTDLSQVKVGAVAGSSTEEALARIRTTFTAYPNARDGLQALRDRQIDAFVYDRPLMAWIVSQDFRYLDPDPGRHLRSAELRLRAAAGQPAAKAAQCRDPACGAEPLVGRHPVPLYRQPVIWCEFGGAGARFERPEPWQRLPAGRYKAAAAGCRRSDEYA